MFQNKFLPIFILTLLISTAAIAQIPRTLSYQGILTDNAGKPRPDQDYPFTFCLYDTAIGGSPLWTEQKTLSVKGGLFSTVLGDQKPFGAAVKFDKQYWLGIQVGSEVELAPRIRLTSVGYSLNAVRADTAKVSLTSLADATWQPSGANIYRINGNIGIGLENPTSKLHIAGDLKTTGDAVLSGKVTTYDEFQRFINTHGQNIETIFARGWMDNILGNGSGSSAVALTFGHNNFNSYFTFKTYHGGVDVEEDMRIYAGNVGIGTKTPTAKLDVAGRTKTQVLEITGSDFAEPFKISHPDSLPVGSLVVIDPEHPGQLKQATESYDKRVAGVISGAGGIYPGIMVTKQDKSKNSQYVAMTGQVYALATAANGAIEPGDLLTTSNIPGHAMKATDHERAFGAVIGKAMSGLKDGEGLVLVLVQPH